jgi:hypothetical protein
MRRAAIFVAALALAPAAHAATPSIAVHVVGSTSGAAPLHVTLTATGDAVSYHWDLGDGSSADGPAVDHTYRAGAFTAKVTGTGTDGSTAQATVPIRSVALRLSAPNTATYGLRTTFRGKLVPAIRSKAELWLGTQRVGVGSVDRRGRVRVRARVLQPGTYELRWGGVASNAVSVRLRPRLHAVVAGTGQLHTPLVLHATVRPAGPLRVEVWRDAARVLAATYVRPVALRLGTNRAAVYRIRVTAVPRAGFTLGQRTIRRDVFVPSLSMGSTGPSVRALEQRLDDLHFALRGVDGAFGEDTRDAAVAFQKLHGLPRTGQVTAVFWHLLLRASTPAARFPGDHIEVNKTRQVLYVVRAGKVVLISHVSTGATGNTPVGRWHVYSKVPGWLPDGMFDSSFFVGAFAIHGYPSVPVYPGSHGCVRLPVWLAPRIYELDPYGTEVDIYN